ncbi:Ribokinase-like protein [Chaetomium sp. MPI-SDFR-AT-0129]|nr:Ribokinase-like protein [Chaetomium sp. MPI-SDFR-AT-0129]
MSSTTPRITVLGSLNMDLVAYVPHHPLPGETLTADEFATSPGGKGANQAVACAKLSRARPTDGESKETESGKEKEWAGETAKVAMVGCVGADPHGTQLRTSLSTHGVNTTGVTSSPHHQTGVALILVDKPTGENRIVLSPGANHALQPADFTPTDTATGNNKDGLDLLRTGSGRGLPDLLIMQLEIPLPTVLAALSAARTAGVPVLLNPAPARVLPDEAYVGLAHLVVNETEAAILSGLSGETAEELLETEAGLEKVARGFVGRGVRNVIITLGGRGVFFFRGGSEGGKGKEVWGLVPAEKAKVVDTTAAGDTFVGRYALDVVGDGGFDIEVAVRRANRAAAKTVERAGAQDSIPWRDELE